MDPLLFLKIIISLFLAILFLQSGLDKVFDWKGNLDFHKEHFANSPLKHFSTANLAFVAFLEICCGALCLVGAAFVLQGDKSYALMGAQLAAVVLKRGVEPVSLHFSLANSSRRRRARRKRTHDSHSPQS